MENRKKKKNKKNNQNTKTNTTTGNTEILNNKSEQTAAESPSAPEVQTQVKIQTLQPENEEKTQSLDWKRRKRRFCRSYQGNCY